MYTKKTAQESGAISGMLIANVVLVILLLAFGSFAIWAYMNYVDHKDNVDKKVAAAVEIAKKQQAEEDEKAFKEREKQPFREFKSPADFGTISLSYPKTWSVYENEKSDDYSAVFYPLVIPNLESDNKKPLALHIEVLSDEYTNVLEEYEDNIKEGKLKSFPTTVNEIQGNRLEGELSEELKGLAIVFKLRDKTFRISTEAPEYFNDFNKTVLESLRFNP